MARKLASLRNLILSSRFIYFYGAIFLHASSIIGLPFLASAMLGQPIDQRVLGVGIAYVLFVFLRAIISRCHSATRERLQSATDEEVFDIAMGGKTWGIFMVVTFLFILYFPNNYF